MAQSSRNIDLIDDDGRLGRRSIADGMIWGSATEKHY
jgi:hypothetical protein